MIEQHAATSNGHARGTTRAAQRMRSLVARLGGASARPLRVLLLNERCHSNPLAGGAETHLFEIFGRLTLCGVHTELLCCGFEGAAPQAEHYGVVITRLGTRLSYYAQVAGEVRRRIAAGEVDLIVEAHNKVPFLSPLYSRGVPVLVIHHHLHGWTAFRQVAPWLAVPSVALEALIPVVYRRVPFLTISASSKTDLVRRGLPEESIDVVPCGVDRNLYAPVSLDRRAPLVVTLGRLEPYKRLDLLVRAWRRVVADVPARLVIIGRGQEEARLRALAARLGLQASVSILGFVSEAEKVRWLQEAALLVQCSTKEGWGLTVTEAYACGTPVVATDVPGLTDSVQDGVTGLLVRRARPAPLAAAITKLLADDEARRRMSRRALAWSANFDWNDTAAAVLRAIRRAVRPAAVPVVVPQVAMPHLVGSAALAADPGGHHEVV